MFSHNSPDIEARLNRGYHRVVTIARLLPEQPIEQRPRVGSVHFLKFSNTLLKLLPLSLLCLKFFIEVLKLGFQVLVSFVPTPL